MSFCNIDNVVNLHSFHPLFRQKNATSCLPFHLVASANSLKSSQLKGLINSSELLCPTAVNLMLTACWYILMVHVVGLWAMTVICLLLFQLQTVGVIGTSRRAASLKLVRASNLVSVMTCEICFPVLMALIHDLPVLYLFVVFLIAFIQCYLFGSIWDYFLVASELNEYPAHTKNYLLYLTHGSVFYSWAIQIIFCFFQSAKSLIMSRHDRYIVKTCQP